MKRSLLTLLCSFVAWVGLHAGESNSPITQISLERTSCFGECPVYKLTVTSDGAVAYEGKESVAEKGKKTSKISEEDFKRLVTKVDDIEFFYLAPGYYFKSREVVRDGRKVIERSISTDLPTQITTVITGSSTNSVRNYDGGPKGLTELECLIDEVTKSSVWIKGQSNNITGANHGQR